MRAFRRAVCARDSPSTRRAKVPAEIICRPSSTGSKPCQAAFTSCAVRASTTRTTSWSLICQPLLRLQLPWIVLRLSQLLRDAGHPIASADQQPFSPDKLRGQDRQSDEDDADARPGENQHQQAGDQDSRADDEHDEASHPGWKQRKPSRDSVFQDHHLHAEFRIEVLPRVRLAAAPDARRRADGDPAEAAPLYVGVTIADARARASRCPPRSRAKPSRFPARPLKAPSTGSPARLAATPPSVANRSLRIFQAASR